MPLNSKMSPAEYEAMVKKNFDAWMAMAVPRLLISQIPPGPDNVLETLLKNAFETGFVCASVELARAAVETLLKDRQ